MIKRINCFVLSLLTVAIITSLNGCSDERSTAPVPLDELDETSSLSVRVNAELALMSDTGFSRLHTARHVMSQIVVPAYGRANTVQSLNEPRTIVKHLRQTDGTTRSLAWHFKRGAELPALMFVFEDGRVQAVVGLAYVRRGNGYLRHKTRVTTFDAKGRPNGQINLTSEPANVASVPPASKSGATLVQSVRDVLSVFAPKELHAEEVGGCQSQYLSVLATSVKLAAATTALQIAGATCLAAPGAQPISCPATLPLFVAWSDALDKWSLALDAWLACLRGPTGSGTNSGSSSTSGDEGDDSAASTETTVQEFIDDAVAKGNYSCSSNGDVCTYYAT